MKHAKFFSPFLTNARKNIKPEFLLLDIVLIVKTFGGEVGGFGGEASPPDPPVDETLHTCIFECHEISYYLLTVPFDAQKS